MTISTEDNKEFKEQGFNENNYHYKLQQDQR